MTKRDVIHVVGWKLAGLTYWLHGVIEKSISVPLMRWNLRIHSWMEYNHACCDRHGYRKGDPSRFGWWPR